MDTTQINQKCKCCACEAPLSYSKHVNLITLEFKAKWQVPVWGNVLTDQSQMASAFICDRCYDAGLNGPTPDIKFAVEFDKEEVIYHPVTSLSRD